MMNHGTFSEHETDPVFVVLQGRVHCLDGASGTVWWTHHFGVAMSPDASTDLCRWGEMIVVAFDAHVIFIRASDGAQVLIARLPAPFQAGLPLRIVARQDTILAYSASAIAALSSSGEVKWATALAAQPQGRMPSIQWRDESRSGVELTFDRRVR